MRQDRESESDQDQHQDIVAENLHAIQAIYFAYQLEEMRAFQVVERLAELFAQGLLPIGPGRTGRLLSTYTFSDQRLRLAERRSLYVRALGAPGGSADDPQPNLEFLSLWLRFIACVALLEPTHGSSQVDARRKLAHAAAWRAAQALARNASVHGNGLPGAVRQLAADANVLREVLRAPEILSAFGARDMWQVIDIVSRNELGGAANVARHRSLAQSGSGIFAWLARHARALNGHSGRVRVRALGDPSLVDAVQMWAAASSSDDGRPSAATAPASQGSGPAVQALPELVHELLSVLGLGQEVVAPGAGKAQKQSAESKGSVACFRGAPGTGKSLAAHAVAAAVSLELVRVDLRQIVSKYVGETEKNLAAVLSRVDPSNAVLLLDEGDALFGTRGAPNPGSGETKESSIGRLLAQLNAHGGLVIFESGDTAGTSESIAPVEAVLVIDFPHMA